MVKIDEVNDKTPTYDTSQIKLSKPSVDRTIVRYKETRCDEDRPHSESGELPFLVRINS